MLDVGLFWHFINTFNRVKYKIKVASVLLRQRWLAVTFNTREPGFESSIWHFFFTKQLFSVN